MKALGCSGQKGKTAGNGWRYYVRALETAGNNGVPAVSHYIIFQKANGSGRVCRAEVNPDTLCRCTGIRDKNLRLVFEHDIMRREIGGEDVIGETNY